MDFMLKNLLAELNHPDVSLRICSSVKSPEARDSSQLGSTSFSVES